MRFPDFTGNVTAWAASLVGQLNREFETRDAVTMRTAALFRQRAVSAEIAATGTTQADGRKLVRDFSEVTTCIAGVDDALVAPLAGAGMQVVIANTTADDAQVFPAAGETIDGGAVDAAITLPAGKAMFLFCFTPGAWRSLIGA